VYTVGAPSGLDLTLGEGLVSSLRTHNGYRYIQTTAPISAGSSGGGLFDSSGNLIGITTFLIRDAQNLNFAVAASDFWKRQAPIDQSWAREGASAAGFRSYSQRRLPDRGRWSGSR
jgi:hypothetical protein